MCFRLAVPVLCVGDVAAAVSFYARLGFSCAAQYPDYLILHRDKVELHARVAKMDVEENPCGAYFFVDDIDALATQLAEQKISLLSQPADQPYNVREFAVGDPWGNLLRFGQLLV